ncbi:MAG: short-chain dehydrogenase [Bacteroidota bacterium]|nr:short-chain dehydrogenase [Bacteroidota bacterium]MDP4232494.1 short-chain dehydrogenase [Bacteroidota bacterium]MDP4241630.1 short-chain dehydrogenase [Bacteroidota bacterium]MDP4286374.1 short-chain dehydrogenase [Bacteroidota bacterium]
MDLQKKRVLVLGGFGLVGQALIQRLMVEGPSGRPSHIIITSLRKEEAESAVKLFEERYAHSGTTFEPFWGNLFVRENWKDLTRDAILADPELRDQLIEDTLGDLTEEVLCMNTLYSAIEWARPDAIIDSINTSTAIAYQDLFTMGQRVKAAIHANAQNSGELVERLLASLYIPQLIRHVQILHRALIDFKVHAYIKIGTSGTGGMGLNIPFTHSEERPSRMLLSKSSIAGAHSLLLFLMARTPRAATIVKEVKPTATIAWKEIGYGPVKKGAKPIELFDVTMSDAEVLGNTLNLLDESHGTATGQVLEAVYVDTGENGIFSKGEFETISALGQMEMITPEEIAEDVVRELTGVSTGKDIIAALDASTMGPTYRAGYLRESALRMLTALEVETGTSSVAFEMLGPPRLAKLLFEAHLLKLAANDFGGMLSHTPEELSKKVETIISENARLRSEIVSIGIPILLADGKKLVRGKQIKIPPAKHGNSIELNDEKRDAYAREGWIDLRPENMAVWQARFARIRDEAESTRGITGSAVDRSPAYWDNFMQISEGRLAAWIFSVEEGGERIKR